MFHSNLCNWLIWKTRQEKGKERARLIVLLLFMPSLSLLHLPWQIGIWIFFILLHLHRKKCLLYKYCCCYQRENTSFYGFFLCKAHDMRIFPNFNAKGSLCNHYNTPYTLQIFLINYYIHHTTLLIHRYAPVMSQGKEST